MAVRIEFMVFWVVNPEDVCITVLLKHWFPTTKPQIRSNLADKLQENYLPQLKNCGNVHSLHQT